jgi:hypothetical protein
MLFRNFGNYQLTLRNLPEERRTILHRSGSLELRTESELVEWLVGK